MWSILKYFFRSCNVCKIEELSFCLKLRLSLCNSMSFHMCQTMNIVRSNNQSLKYHIRLQRYKEYNNRVCDKYLICLTLTLYTLQHLTLFQPKYGSSLYIFLFSGKIVFPQRDISISNLGY